MNDWNRRELLAAGGLAAGALATGAQAQGERKLGYAIVGLGYYATQIIMPQFKNCRRSRITGLVSGDSAKAKRLAAEYGVPERSIYDYKSYDRIADNPDIDAVYVILPNSMHAEYTVRAARAGKHVLCEKPMSNTVAEAQEMIAACRRAGKKLMIGYRCHFEPYNLHAIRLIREGAIGKLRWIDTQHGFVQRDATKWRLKRALAGGGSLADMGVYSLQAARYLTGEEPVSVVARSSTDRTDPRFREVEDLIEWTLTFPGGALASCQSSYSSSHNRYRATGSEGFIDLEPATSYEGQKMRLRRKDAESMPVPPAGPGKTMFAAQLDHLADCVFDNREPIVAGEEGLRDMRIVEAIYRSADTGRRIDL
jgi:predicted dehydrogenase